MRRAAIRPAFTLIELAVVLAIASVLFLAMGSVLVLASRALPDRNNPLLNSVQAAQAVDQIAREVESALYVSQLSANSIAFTVADRNGDGMPERISYSWSGVAGAPLLRKYNDAAPVVAVDTVNTFNLVSNVQYVSETYPGPGVEDTLASLLQDCTASTNLNSQSFGNTASTNFGQFFMPTFTSDVVGWRPTSLTQRMMMNRIPGSFRVQMRSASPALLLPTSTVLEEQSVNSLTLLPLMQTSTFDFSTLPRLSPGDAICVALMWDSGQGPAKIETNSSGPGLLKTSGTPTSWSYSSNNCLSAQIWGMAMRAGPPQTATTQYLLTLGISLRAGAAASPIAQTSALALNHPELVAGLWELKFNQDPTTVDVNGDGAADWRLASGGAFNAASITGGAWNTSSDTLSTAPGNDFNAITVADLRMQSVAAGATAGFSINACRTANRCVPLTAALVLQADGTQTLSISQLTSDIVSTPLISFSNLPSTSVDLHLVIDPTAMGVAVRINGVQRGAFPLTRVSVSDSSKSASLFGSGGAARFSYARVRILGAQQ